MEIEVIFERTIAWIDNALNDPNTVQVIEQALTALDGWLQADLASKGNPVTPPAQPPAQSATASPLLNRAKASSMDGHIPS